MRVCESACESVVRVCVRGCACESVRGEVHGVRVCE